jgi:hypothetical protein
MRARHLTDRTTAGAVMGVLAVTGALLLSACGGGSSTESSTTSDGTASAATADTETSSPPRPSSISDADWTGIVAALEDTESYRSNLLAKSPDELADSCQNPAMTAEDRMAAASSGVDSFPGTTAEEWTALYDYYNPAMQAVKDEVCAQAPAASSTGANPAGAGTLGDSAAAAAAAAITCDGNETPCALGNTGPGGGIVFYVDTAGFACGDGYECTTLEGAPAGWNGSDEDPYAIWCATDKPGYDALATDGGNPDPFTSVPGTGWTNTGLVVEACGADSAAGLASGYSGGGLDDWFLPSTDEFQLLARPMFDTGSTQTWNGMNNGRLYWTSSQSASSPAGADQGGVPMVEGNGGIPSDKTESAAVHPIRAF